MMLGENGRSPAKCVLFDFDGTLADSEEYMLEALHAVLQSRGLPPLDDKRIPAGGPGALLRAAGVPDKDVKAAKRDLWERYESTNYLRTKLFPGAAELLSELEKSGWRWSVVTNKPGRFFFPITENLGWKSNPALVADGKKPEPDGLLRAVEILGAEPQHCAYAGDERKDAETAEAAEMPFIWAKWGAKWRPSPEEISGLIDGVAETPADVFRHARALIQPGD